MIRLNRFDESNNFKHNRLSVEELEDYIIQHIDNGDLEYYYSGIEIGSNKVSTCWKLNRKFYDITTIDKLTDLNKLISSLADICKRWNFDFKFELMGIGNKPGGGGPHQTQFIIRQEIPTEILKYFNFNYSSFKLSLPYTLHSQNKKVHEIQCFLKQDKNMNFYFLFKLDKPLEYKDLIIDQLKNQIKIPFEFIDKKEDFISWYFKLLV